MKIIADFHLHSKYSRATSPQMELGFLAQTAVEKGINLLGTGDFTHPQWFKEIKEKLAPAESGLFILKSKIKNPNQETRFMLTSEISCIYPQGGKTRKIHILVFAPSIEAVEKINSRLSKIGNLKADGRPILGLSAMELTKIVLEANPNCFVVPAHIMTPWFSVFGSKSGFDSLEECFGPFTKYIYALETGLSADPKMLCRMPAIASRTLISSGDAHSPAKLGREACVFDTNFSYPVIIEAIKTKNPAQFLKTIEFFPQEGKYHYDGHRLCNFSCPPQDTKKHHGLCPVCSRPLVVGVLNRVEQLACQPVGFKPDGEIPFQSLIPLTEIIAETLNRGVNTKAVDNIYQTMLARFGSEFAVLLETPLPDLKADFPIIAEAMQRMRQGKAHIVPGYDGVYGKVALFSPSEKKSFAGQKTLF